MDSLLVNILDNWINPSEITNIETVKKGATNQTFRVIAKSGTYYLRLYSYLNVDRIKREHELLQILASTDIPAVTVIHSKHNNTFLEDSAKYYCLYREVKGEQASALDLRLEHVEGSAIALARLHKATRNFYNKGYVQWALNWDGEVWANRFDIIIKAIEKKPAKDVTDNWALERSKAQQRWLRDKKCTHSYECQFANQVIHGDFHHHNIFFDENAKVSGIIDWESAGFMPRAYEIIRACAFMFTMNKNLCKVFIETYNKHNPLKREELEDGARAWGCFSDHHVWPLEELYLKNNISASTFIPHVPFTPFMESWEGVSEELEL